ncbi:hypothetical protein C4D60_Mb01t08380 [Musa balbisiana]|uniref:Uncharacterized protein n=1 Tax=Musa balbisiana TaxID=52838 RepID=A0A4V4H778_MUSBA|nr:hypothetical protein C4D60_Mb01t08380 [Musa balbisiana]
MLGSGRILNNPYYLNWIRLELGSDRKSKAADRLPVRSIGHRLTGSAARIRRRADIRLRSFELMLKFELFRFYFSRILYVVSVSGFLKSTSDAVIVAFWVLKEEFSS